MKKTLARAGVLTATAITAVALQSGAASAAPCNDPVVGALHAAHNLTGDPGGVAHGAEETYCGVKP